MAPASLGALGLGCALDTTGLVGTKDAGGAVLARDAGSGADAGVGSEDGSDGNDAAPAPQADGIRIESATFSKVVAGASSVSLVVTGRGIVPGAQVCFDNLVYPLLRSGEDWIADQLQLPAAGGKYLLTIVNPPPDGQEDSRFMTVFWPAPTVTTVTASRALAGATNVSLSVTGTGFVDGAQVILGSVFPTSGVRSAVFKSSTELRVDGISLPATVGEYSVLVSNPDPTVLNGTSAKLTVRSAISSCAALKRGNPIAPSGVHFVDPDGKGPDLAFPVYCEMNDDGSAWALLFTMVKADGSLCSDNSGTKPASCIALSGEAAVEPNTGSYLSKELA